MRASEGEGVRAGEGGREGGKERELVRSKWLKEGVSEKNE